MNLPAKTKSVALGFSRLLSRSTMGFVLRFVVYRASAQVGDSDTVTDRFCLKDLREKKRKMR